MPVDAQTIETPRDFERMLRDAGFSRARAKAITAKGFKQGAFRDAVDQDMVANIVQTLDTRRYRLDLKRKKGGSKIVAAAVEGFFSSATTFFLENEKERRTYEAAIDLIVSLSRRNRRYKNEHLVELEANRPQSLVFPQSHERSLRKLLIVPSAGDRRTHKFRGELRFARWQGQSVQSDSERFNLDTARNRGVTINVGTTRDIADWLASLDSGKLRQAQNALREPQPVLLLTYLGSGEEGDNRPAKFLVSLR